MMLNSFLAILVGYLLGSIPFGLLLTKFAGLGDIRSIGSGNIGATNVLRTGNKGLAAATLLLDGGKAFAAVFVARYFIPDPSFSYALAGFAAFLGHIFPVWLKFNGGKGVATYIGAMLAISWPVGLVFCALWLFIAYTMRISSLSALGAALATPVFGYIYSGTHLAATAGLMSLLLFFTHRENFKRLLAGTEPKIGEKKDDA